MPDAGTFRAFLPVAAAMALLLTAGVAALVQLLSRRAGFSKPWKTALVELAATAPWRGGDLPFLLILVVLAQVARHFLSAAIAWDMLAFQGVLAAGILWRARRKTRPFGVPAAWPGTLREAVVRWLAILPVLWFAAFVWQLGLKAAGHEPALQTAIQVFVETGDIRVRALFIVFAVVFAPFAEEVLFRGILLPLLVRRTGARAGVALTALGFAALHGDMGTFIALGVFSVALSLAYARTGSLWVPLGMHALFNGANLALVLSLHRAGVI